MSIERLLLNRNRPAEGFTPAPTSEQVAVPRSVRGGAPSIMDLGHRQCGQTMRRHMELRTHTETCEVRADGRIAPGETASLIQKVGGSASMTLVTPPGLPSEQIGKSGKPRRQSWMTELWVFHESEATITWPSEVKWGGDGKPANPRPAGTADVFGVRYITATGQWWVLPLAVGVAAEMPVDDGTTTPPPPGPGDDGYDDGSTPPGDDGAPNDGSNPPENTYTDPETGETLTPEQPIEVEGNLVALHDGGVSLSADGGSTWRSMSGPMSAKQMSPVLGSGYIVSTVAGEAWFSSALENWTKLVIENEVAEEIPLTNGDFETGDLTGWQIDIDNADPVISASTSPQQAPGSTHYLARDPAAPNGGTYSVKQEVMLTADPRTLRLSANVYAAASAEAEIKLVVESENHRFTRTTGIGPKASNTQNQKSSPLNQIVIEGLESHHGSIGNLSTLEPYFQYYGPEGWWTETLEIKIGDWHGKISTRPASTPNSEAAAKEAMEIFDWDDVKIRKELRFEMTNPAWPGENIVLVFPAGWRLPLGRRQDSVAYLLLDVTSGSLTGEYPARLYTEREKTEVLAVSDSARSGWQNISCELDSTPEGPVDIRLTGRGSPADAYFDHVRLEMVETKSSTVGVVAPDHVNRRHLIATADSLHTRSSEGLRRVGPAPVVASVMAARGDVVLLSDGTSSAFISADGGKTFSTVATPAPVVQLIAHPRRLAVLDTGALYDLDAGATLYTLSPGATAAWAERYGRIIMTTAAGGIWHSSDFVAWSSFKSQPAGGPATRRTTPTESGRLVGYSAGVKDLFFTDSPADGWKLSHSLLAPIISISEVR